MTDNNSKTNADDPTSSEVDDEQQDELAGRRSEFSGIDLKQAEDSTRTFTLNTSLDYFVPLLRDLVEPLGYVSYPTAKGNFTISKFRESNELYQGKAYLPVKGIHWYQDSAGRIVDSSLEIDLIHIDCAPLDLYRIRVTTWCAQAALRPAYDDLLAQIGALYRESNLAPALPAPKAEADNRDQSARRGRGAPLPAFSKEERRRIGAGWHELKAKGGVRLEDYARQWNITGSAVRKYEKQYLAGELD